MGENKILSFVEFCKQYHKDKGHKRLRSIEEISIEFAKYHVKLALEKASEEANLLGEGVHMPITDTTDSVYYYDSNGPDYVYRVNKSSIVESYDETLIK